MLYAELDSFEPVAIQERDGGDGWRVFFRAAGDRDSARATLAAEFGNALLAIAAIEVDDEDWARRSQAALTSVRVGRIIIAPPWDLLVNPESLIVNPRIPDPGVITIVIDPSTGFGTGHHASTRLSLELLQRRDIQGARVIDVGTGSGVLALAAWRLGAAHVIAIDNDPDALDNARENVIRNGAAQAITIEQLDLTNASLEPADLVIANLTGAILQRHAVALRRLLTSNGRLIVSGFTLEEQEDVLRAFELPAKETAREGEWISLMF